MGSELKKIISDFSIFFFNFFTRLMLSEQADKNTGRYGILRPSRKWAYLQPISKHGDEKFYIRFLIFFFIFFNRVNIIRSSRKRYGEVWNFNAFQKISLLPTNIQTRRRKKLDSIFHYLSLLFFS